MLFSQNEFYLPDEVDIILIAEFFRQLCAMVALLEDTMAVVMTHCGKCTNSEHATLLDQM